MVLAVGGQATVATAATTANEKPPASYILIDNDTGNVLTASNEHAPLPPASTTKLLTALVVSSKLHSGDMVTISAKAASMPAMKIGLQAGQRWRYDDLLRCLLMISANDAAVALAEAASGDLGSFATARAQAAQQLGLKDSPVFKDPAGLDDAEFSNDGGDRVSTRDMAIIGRAVLADPQLAEIVKTQKYEFFGGDGQAHTLTNHNKMLAQYAGAIGVKPGYTTKAKQTMVAAATRNGRTMLAVAFGADNPYNKVSELMDQGFATPVSSEPSTDHVTLTKLTPANVEAAVAAATPAKSEGHRDLVVRVLGALFIGGFALMILSARGAEARRRLDDLVPHTQAEPAD
jgi:serine-type D-Ala-D-Ala carboxypeptidase (penicillin-binding protein 5/6)